ncbi:MAG: hypothetical protein HYR96_05995 [Deltaproteobacteria bacterium]|nr:hypothetical protein [Deltaproteobacteria bacterium]MBI3293111.1 hypothetical protein [Deltaproteobacteria bacterium]
MRWALLALLVWAPLCLAESEDSSVSSESSGEVSAISINAALKKKLRLPSGEQVKVVLMRPITNEELKDSEVVYIGIEKSLARLDGITVRRSDYSIPKMNFEQLKRATAKTHGDVILIPSFKPTRWALVLYDRRTPYQVVMHSEVLPDTMLRKPTDLAKTNLTRTLVTQVFSQYATDQLYDLPREEGAPLLQADIPRWMASAGLMKNINRELLARWYVAASVGGAVASGIDNRTSNSSLLGLQLGYRPFKGFLNHLFIEVGGEFFNYNAFLVGLKYYIQSKTTTARFYLGLQHCFVTNKMTLTSDPSENALGSRSQYAVPSVAMVVPVGDILIKAEFQYFVATDDHSNSIFTFMPGLLLPF